MVFALRSEYWMGRRQFVPMGPPVRTDDTGQFRVIGLPPGTYVVRATTRETWTVTRSGVREVMSFAPTYFPGTPDVKEAGRITIGIAQHSNGIDFPLVPGRTVKVSGTAFDSHGRPLAGQDVAWLFQPYLAFLGSMLALSLYGAIAGTLRKGWVPALAAFVASQAALLFGYALWGGVKEVAAAWMVALAAAVIGPTVRAAS